MTIPEAEKILGFVQDALMDMTHLNHPISALKGYDIYDICTALRLRIANEFLFLSNRPDFEEHFEEGLKLYEGMPCSIAMTFVPDDQVDDIRAKEVFNPIDPYTMRFLDPASLEFTDQRPAASETATAFGQYCKTLGATDPLYWQKIYRRLNLDHTGDCPHGNRPVRF
jgi:hypothetical protein